VPPGLGFLLDKKFGTLPILSIVGSIFGLISLFVQLRQLIREMPQGPTRKK
jgi:F0F1-type ATP synthase assembly protein I